MKVRQLNLRKSFAATSLFGATLPTNTVGLLTEPYHYRNKICKLGYNFDLFPDTTLDQPPRAAILIPKSFDATYLPHLSGPDVTVVYFKTQHLLIVSGYCDGKLPVIQDWLTKIMEYVNNRNCKVVFGLDSNAHSELYGHDTDRRGELMEEFIFVNNLEIENKGDIPTFATLRRDVLATSFIDITLSKDVNVVNWHVDESFNNSDHNALSYEILTVEEPPKLVRPWKRANWLRFRRIIENHHFFVPDILTNKKLDNMVRVMYKVLNRALDMSCPLRPTNPTEQNLKWWNNSLNRKTKKLNKQYKIAKRCKTLSETVKLKIMKQKFKKACKQAKRTSWRKYILSLKDNDRMASLAKTLQCKERSKLHTLRKPDGSFTEPGKETLDLLFETHFPASTPLRDVNYTSEVPHSLDNSSESIKQKFSDWISLPLVSKAMKKFNKKKSPGPDGIKPIIFEHLPINFKEQLVFIFKCCVHLRYTPVLWKDTKVSDLYTKTR